jgi:hypothetical protein
MDELHRLQAAADLVGRRRRVALRRVIVAVADVDVTQGLDANALAPRDEPLFMDLWTWSLREAARGSGVQRPAPHHSERVPPPLKLHAPSSPHLLSTMRAQPLTRGIPETPRMPNAAPHACACGGRPLVRGRVWRHRGARARDAFVPPSVGVTEPTPPRGATPMSRSRLMPPGHRTARGGHTPERDVGPAGLPRSALQSRPMRG